MNATRSDGLSETQKGLIYALSCYLIWGTFPLYWYPLTHSVIGADQLLAQRVVWSSVFVVIVVAVCGYGRTLLDAFSNRRLLSAFIFSSAALAVNWLVFLWAVTHNHVLDSSLGYFISPLVSIMLGCFFLKECINRTQIIAILLAVTGILWLAIPAGRIPWVALLLAASFGIYGLLRKTTPMDALPGLALETLLMLPFAAAYLVWTAWHGGLIFSELPPLPLALLVCSGIATTIPLIFFAAGARRIPLSHFGMIQYITPTSQLIVGLTVFRETFTVSRFIGYIWVWFGVAVYLFGIWQQYRAGICTKNTI
ncbi:EamA family transporter RarD [Neisseria arctica]|nr:EamA family transporter RarD [Neisseria arctica]UOO86688.1 EamA family transporter RarD [Neisseria arctica]